MPGPDDVFDDVNAVTYRRILQVRCLAVQRGDFTIRDPLLEEVRAASRADGEIAMLVKALLSGNIDKASQRTGFYNIRRDLSTDDGLLIFGSRLVIPKNMRKDITTRLHASHQGITRTLQRARQCVFWPGITSDITNTVRSCTSCQERLASQHQEPMIQDAIPSRPFESVSSDLFEHAGKHYLAYADRYTGWPCIDMWRKSPTAVQVVTAVRNHYVNYGCPKRARSDGGPQFKAALYKKFQKDWNVEPIFSTPYYPQSNGHAEVSVRALKNLVAKSTSHGDIYTDEFQRALLELRNTPREALGGKSPAQALFGRQLRSNLPLSDAAFKALDRNPHEDIARAHTKVQAKAKRHYDDRSRPLPALKLGQPVLIQDPVSHKWTTRGHVVGIGKHRDYDVETADGDVKWRNRRFIRPDHAPAPTTRSPPTPRSSPTPTSAEPPAQPRKPKKNVSFATDPVRQSDRLRKKNIPSARQMLGMKPVKEKP